MDASYRRRRDALRAQINPLTARVDAAKQELQESDVAQSISQAEARIVTLEQSIFSMEDCARPQPRAAPLRPFTDPAARSHRRQGPRDEL